MTSRRNLLGAVLALMLAAVPVTASSRMCPYGNPCEAAEASVIFVGTALKVEHDVLRTFGGASEGYREEAESYQVTEMTFLVSEPFRGVSQDRVQIISGYSHDERISEQEQYLVFAPLGELGVPRLEHCTYTRELSRAGPLLEYLRAMKGGERPTAILGQARWFRREKQDAFPEIDYLANRRVTLWAPDGSQLSTTTARDGRYQFVVDSGGPYSLSLDTPEGVPPFRDVSLVAAPGTCNFQALEARKATSVRGWVALPSGEPGVKVIVDLIPEAWQAGISPRPDRTRTDEEGRFLLQDLTPGRYRLVVNPTGEPGFFPTHYYPGTSDFAEAYVVTVGEDEQIDLGFFPLPDQRRFVMVSGRLINPDGTPIPKAILVMVPESGHDGSAKETGPEGEFQFVLWEGFTYLPRLHGETAENRSRFTPVVPQADQAPIHVVRYPRISDPETGGADQP